jgi:hypothetical protein
MESLAQSADSLLQIREFARLQHNVAECSEIRRRRDLEGSFLMHAAGQDAGSDIWSQRIGRGDNVGFLPNSAWVECQDPLRAIRILHPKGFD